MRSTDGRLYGSIPDTPIPPVPRPPNPSADAGIAPAVGLQSPEPLSFHESDVLDVFKLKSLVALKMLCKSIEALMRHSSDTPPILPITQTSIPSLGFMHARKENFILHNGEVGVQKESSGREDEHGKDKIPIDSPEAHPNEPLHIIGACVESLSLQYNDIARKFYSKKPPPIGLEEYLSRLHKFCPMSTAVYLATSVYIYRLAMVETTMPITSRNVHRLVLAGLRVAMKALEDQSYPHQRFAKVGGVSEPELTRLEISFCFVTNFELKVDAEMLLEHVKRISKDKLPSQLSKG